jgi:hypothetical protein
LVLEMKVPHGAKWADITPLASAIGSDTKGKVSLAAYRLAIPLA